MSRENDIVHIFATKNSLCPVRDDGIGCVLGRRERRIPPGWSYSFESINLRIYWVRSTDIQCSDLGRSFTTVDNDTDAGSVFSFDFTCITLSSSRLLRIATEMSRTRAVMASTSGTFSTAIPFHPSAKYTDAETGLLYYGYRYYQPAIGRWLSRDPIEEMDDVNILGFVCNNAIGFADATGLWKAINRAYGTWATTVAE